MYGGGSCQMSVRRRWDERVGCEVSVDEGGLPFFAGGGGCSTLLRCGIQQQEVLEENVLHLSGNAVETLN